MHYKSNKLGVVKGEIRPNDMGFGLMIKSMPFRLEVGLHCLTMSYSGFEAKKPNFDLCEQQTGYYRVQTCYIQVSIFLEVIVDEQTA